MLQSRDKKEQFDAITYYDMQQDRYYLALEMDTAPGQRGGLKLSWKNEDELLTFLDRLRADGLIKP